MENSERQAIEYAKAYQDGFLEAKKLYCKEKKIDNSEMISELTRIELEHLKLPPCFVCDMDAIKEDLLNIVERLRTDKMTISDLIALHEIIKDWLRREEQS